MFANLGKPKEPGHLVGGDHSGEEPGKIFWDRRETNKARKKRKIKLKPTNRCPNNNNCYLKPSILARVWLSREGPTGVTSQLVRSSIWENKIWYLVPIKSTGEDQHLNWNQDYQIEEEEHDCWENRSHILNLKTRECHLNGRPEDRLYVLVLDSANPVDPVTRRPLLLAKAHLANLWTWYHMVLNLTVLKSSFWSWRPRV